MQRFLARAGVASRRGSEALMTAGRVSVNGVVTTELGAKVDPKVDVVTVDGVRVLPESSPATYVLHKPRGFVTTMSDPQGRPSVAELFPDGPAGLFPVGRLDRDTTGVLLLTTDGELGHRLMHPRYHVRKTYLAKVDGVPTEAELARLRDGLDLDDGPTRPAEVEIVQSTSSTAEVRLVLREGRKRQVRRMLSAVGHPVIELHRESFGPIELGDLPEGASRPLTDGELRALREESEGGET